MCCYRKINNKMNLRDEDACHLSNQTPTAAIFEFAFSSIASSSERFVPRLILIAALRQTEAREWPTTPAPARSGPPARDVNSYTERQGLRRRQNTHIHIAIMRPTLARMAGGNGEHMLQILRALNGELTDRIAVNLDPALVRYASMSPTTWKR